MFSGCGGLDLAFERQGFEVVCAIDNDVHSVHTYNNNLNPVANVVDVTTSDFDKLLSKYDGINVVVGGFPCQGFSKAGPKRIDDPRNKLYLAMVHAIAQLKPVIFVAENVDGLNQNFNGVFLEKIKKDFGELGYEVQERTFNAVGFGVAQHRRRTFIIGFRDRLAWVWPKYSHVFTTRNGERRIEDIDVDFSESHRARVIRDVIDDLLDLKANVVDHEVEPISRRDQVIAQKIGVGQKLCNVRFSETSVYTWDIPEVFGPISESEKIILETIARNRRKKIYGSIPNGNPLPVEEIERLSGVRGVSEKLDGLLSKGYLKDVDGKYDLKGAMFCSGLYKRPNWSEPSPTVLTNFYNPRYFLHPLQDRPFSVRECARLQSFPDWFSFSGPIKEKYRQIGNAVPPLMADALALSVKYALSSEDQKFLAG